ncbi:MAG: hypothetical protein P8R04_06815 [Gammaproteobacteria bacterium]|nr:hypothetical protein [Gammaproteobacteria bacterium]
MKLLLRNFPKGHALVLLVLSFLAGCSQQVRVDGQWQESTSRQESFSRVLIVGVSNNANARCDFEFFLTSQVRATGAEAKSSCVLMKTSENLTVESIAAAVAEWDADAVLATVLVSSEKGVMKGGKDDTRGGLDFKAIGTGYASPYYGGYGLYGVPVIYGQFEEAPVITTTSGDAAIRTMLYATNTESLVYELITYAKDLGSRDNALGLVTPPIVEKLLREGLLPPKD